MFSNAASVEFCTAATVAEDGELCFWLCFWPELVALLLTRVTLDELNSRELLAAATADAAAAAAAAVDEPLAENCSSRSMSSKKNTIRGSARVEWRVSRLHSQVIACLRALAVNLRLISCKCAN